MWCLIKSQETFSFIPSTHIFKQTKNLRNNLLGKVKVRLWMFKNLEDFQRQCQTGNKRRLFGLCGVRLGRESNWNQRNSREDDLLHYLRLLREELEHPLPTSHYSNMSISLHYADIWTTAETHQPNLHLTFNPNIKPTEHPEIRRLVKTHNMTT